MMQPPRQICAISPKLSFHLYSFCASRISWKPCAYEQIFEQYSASWIAATSALREPLYLRDGPLSTFAAATRSSLIALRQRANTDSAMVGAGTPISSAFTDVHLPVPFWPAVSRITSTIGFRVTGSFCCRMSAVISIRKLPSIPRFHSAKIAPISGAFSPSRPCITA